jgi:hypothetical protein
VLVNASKGTSNDLAKKTTVAENLTKPNFAPRRGCYPMLTFVDICRGGPGRWTEKGGRRKRHRLADNTHAPAKWGLSGFAIKSEEKSEGKVRR